MSNQKAVGSSNTETRTSSSPMHNTDTFSTLVSGEGRTSRVITNSTSVSEEVIGTTASYTEMIRFGVLVQDSSSLLENKRADSSQRTVDITGPETVPLKVHSPKTAFSPLSEDNVTATGNTESRWDADSTMSRLPTASTGTSSARVNRHEERTSPLEMDKVTLTDSARTELVSQTEVTLAFDQTQFSPHATQSSRRSSTSGTAPSPNPSARVVLAHSLFPPKTAAEDSDQPRSSSKTEKSTFNSHTDSSLVSSRSVRGGERMLRTLRNIRSSYNATETASTFGSDISSDSGYTDSSYVLTPELTGGMNLPLGDTDSTAAALTHSQATSGAAVEVSHQPRSHSNMEESVSSSHSNSLPVSGPPDRSGERTLRTLRDIHSSHNATQISTTLSSETSSSSDLTGSSYVLTPEQTVGMNASLGEMHFTDTALLHSQAPLETTDAGNSQNTLGNFSTETRTAETESGFSSAILRRGGGTLRSLTNWSKSTDATERSAFDVEAVSSLHFTQTPSVTVNNETTSVSSTEVDFTESSEDPLLTYFNETSVSSSSTKDLSGTGSSHQPVDISDRERRISSASTDSVYLSTTFQHVGERTLRSLPDNITSPDGSGSSTSKTEVSESSDSSLTSPSVAETEEYKASLSEVQSTEPSTQHLLEHSSLVPLYLASPKDSSTIGSASVSSSGTEASVSHSSTNSMYSSAPLSRREQTLPPIINNTLLEVTESTSSYMEKSEASEQNPSSSEAYSQRTDFPVQDFDVSVPSTETFQSLSSSRIPTSSSFQSEPSVPPQQDSRSSTPPPVWLSSSESVLPSSTSAFPSPLPPSSQTTLMAFSPGLSSTTPPPLPPFASLLPVQSSASSSLQPSESFESSFSLAASEGTTGIDLSIVGSSPSEYNHQTGTYPLKESTSLRATGPSLLLTETTEQPTHHSSAVMISRAETETSREQNVSLPGTSIEKTVPILTTSPTYLPEGTTEIAKATTSMFPSSTTQKDVFSLAEVTTQEKRTTTCTMLELTPLPASTDYSATLKPPTVPPPSSTKVSHTSGTPSKQMEMSSATNVKVTEPSISVTHPPKTFSPSQTIARPFPTLPVPSNPTTAAWLGNSKTSPVSHGKGKLSLKFMKLITAGRVDLTVF
ncbi:hypothetical protein lerEdw1_013607 [Lerista edwardsae]|nr:hypothetical protein lerEdw1_013608 [Lerista edwardsae]KAJ6644733.1 hypothetical protein lerEdw1_013607 [Lerista edwardsae]